MGCILASGGDDLLIILKIRSKSESYDLPWD